MENELPLVSVSMIAYNAQEYIAEAIEGVLMQKTDFPIELVIGDDCSRDRTREICEQYAAQHSGIIRILPRGANLGIAGNTARTMGSCRGKYIAVCDGDDVWIDPLKLQKQVAFLEKHPDYGVVYSDVETIDESGKAVKDFEQDVIRRMYKSGEVFFDLLESNFINNSTAIFRRDLFKDHHMITDRSHQIPDYFRWLHMATRAMVHFQNEKTTAYRRHSNSLSVAVPASVVQGNRRAFQRSLFRIILDFDRFSTRRLFDAEKKLLFRKMLSLIWRRPGSIQLKWQIAQRLPKYFPGFPHFFQISMTKILAAIPDLQRLRHAYNLFIQNMATMSKLEGMTAVILDEQLIFVL